MVYPNRVGPSPRRDSSQNRPNDTSPIGNGLANNLLSYQKEFNDVDSVSTVGLEESSYLKLKPFTKLDPTLGRLLLFLNCFGLFVTCKQTSNNANDRFRERGSRRSSLTRRIGSLLRISLMIFVVAVSGEVVYDINLRQSKLLAEQKRSTPLLTFVIVAYSWLSLVIPIICDISLLLIGSLLFRFYSRTTATVCDGLYFGHRTSVDYWYYYLGLVLLAFLDAMGQVIVLGVWPKVLDRYMRMLVDGPSVSGLNDLNPTSESLVLFRNNETTSGSYAISMSNTTDQTLHDSLDHSMPGETEASLKPQPAIKAYILDYLLGEEHSNGDLGVCIKLICLMIQFIHSYAFFIIIISIAHHYASAINDINDNLDKYEFRKLLKQLIILRDSNEQISLMISLPFSCITILVFMRAIALSGVIIQSTMLPYENWSVSLQAFTCTVSIIMVFIYCDGLQSASKQTHRLKTEHIVINENKGGNQSIYEFLDYLNRLSKSIRITCFNIIAINKGSLISLIGHILTLTFVTS